MAFIFETMMFFVKRILIFTKHTRILLGTILYPHTYVF